MKQKKSILKEITATVMPQTEEGLQTLMEQTGLTIGEVIDRLALQIYPEKPEQAILLAEEQVIFSLTKLTEKQTEKALTEIIIFLAGYVPAGHLMELQKKVAASREKNLERFKQEVEQLPPRDAKKLMKELAILEKIREQA